MSTYDNQIPLRKGTEHQIQYSLINLKVYNVICLGFTLLNCVKILFLFLQVFEKMGGQGYSDTLEAILYLRDEIGPMGLLTTPTFTRSLALLSLGSNGTSLVEDWLNLYLRNSLGNNFRDCQRSRYSDLVYVLWTMANLLPSRPVVPGERRWSSSFEDIFECVHSHSKEILSSTEVRKHNWV